MMKSSFSKLVLLCAVLFVIAGCGSNDPNNTSSNVTPSETPSETPSAPAQISYPEKDITMIVPWAAGGGTDVIGRQLAALMEIELGKPVMVVNRDGGGGMIGFQEIANAKPDGYTIGIITNSLLLQKYANDTHVDYKLFAPISVFNYDPAGLTVKSDAKWNSAKEFIDEALKEPSKIGIANSGPGAIWHVAALALGDATGAKFKHVPFKGANPAAIAVAGGHVEATTASAAEVQTLVKSGDLKLLAVASEERLPQFPDVPTLKEEGIDTVIGVWRGLVAPKGTPVEVIQALENAVAKAVASTEFIKFMETGNFGITHVPASEFGPFMDNDDATYAELFKEIEK